LESFSFLFSPMLFLFLQGLFKLLVFMM